MAEPVARFMNRDAVQLRFYAAKAVFRCEGRLTGFRGARNIVRVRTKCTMVNDATFATMVIALQYIAAYLQRSTV